MLVDSHCRRSCFYLVAQTSKHARRTEKYTRVIIWIGGVVPAGETVCEVIGHGGELKSRSGQECNYVLVSWDGADDKPQRIGWIKVSDSLATVPTETGIGRHQKLGTTGAIDLSWTAKDGEIKHGELCCWIEDSKTIGDEDTEPIFGLQAVLETENFQVMSRKTKSWFVETTSFVEMAFITRAALLQLLQEHWPQTCGGNATSDGTYGTTSVRDNCCKEPSLHASTPDMVGGQRALGQLVLMDHGIVDANGSSDEVAPDDTVETAQPQHDQPQPHSHQKLPVQSFDDCARRFDALEAQLTDVLTMQKQVLRALSSLQARPR